MIVMRVHGIPETLAAFDELPRKMRFKHLRIALNAAGGIIRDQAQHIVRRQSGILAKSLAVKVDIPDASRDERHHGKPAYAMIGPKRRSGRFLRITAKGAFVGFGAAQRELIAERKRLAAGKTLSPLQREKEASRFVKASFPNAVYRNPSRYAHLLESGHGGPRPAPAYPFLGPAVAMTKERALSKAVQKLREGLEQESKAVFTKTLEAIAHG